MPYQCRRPYNLLTFTGKIESFYAPGGAGIRLDLISTQNTSIPPYYDSMIAKTDFSW